MSYVRFLLCLPVLIALAVTDYKTHRIPKKYPLYLLLVAVGFAFIEEVHPGTMLLEGLGVGIPLFLVFVITKGAMLGGGDVKLMTVVGMLLGTTMGYLALLIGACVALLVELPKKKRGCAFAFGPYLAVGIGACLLLSLT